MDNIASTTDKQRKSIFTDVATKLNLPPYIVEKDFWVSWSLDKIFANPKLRDVLRFNGGTSISKAYRIIERIPADVDLILKKDVVLMPEEKLEQPSKTKQAAFDKQIEKRDGQFIQSVLKDTISRSLTGICSVESGPERHILQISYHQVFDYDYTLPTIKLEIGSLSLWEPYEEVLITSFVSNVLPELKIKNPIVPTITAVRTFWEKIIILHREAHRPINANTPPSRCSRHYYDIFRLGHSNIKETALTNVDTLKYIVEFNIRFYPRGWAKYDEAKPGTIKLIPPEHSIPALKSDYERVRPGFYGYVPDFENILAYLTNLESDINNLSR